MEVRKCQFGGGGDVDEVDDVDVLLDWVRVKLPRLGRSSCWIKVLKEVRVLMRSSTSLMSKGSVSPPNCWLRRVVRMWVMVLLTSMDDWTRRANRPCGCSRGVVIPALRARPGSPLSCVR